MKNILLTRSEDNQLLQQKLRAKGFVCHQIPLITYINLLDRDDVTGVLLRANYSNIIITSKYAAKLICDAKNIGNIDEKYFWVVGQASANILGNNGYNIKETASTARQLIEKLPSDILSDMLYLSGDHITTDMPEPVRRLIIYKVQYKNNLSSDEIEMIKNGMNYVTLYSENSAKTLYTLLSRNNLLKYMEDSVLVAISEKVANIMSGCCKDIITMNNSDDLINSLYKYEQKSPK